MDLRWRGKGKKKKKAGFVFIELKVAWGRVSVAQDSNKRLGMMRKAYELSVLCDIDIALIMFSPSPSQRLSHFSGKKRIEDVFIRYINLPDQEREHALIFPEQGRHPDIQNKEYLVRTLQQLKSENEVALQLTNPAAINSEIEELEQEVSRLQQQLHMAEEQIRAYEPDPLRMTSMGELESCEKHLLDTLTCVLQRKEYLLSNHLSTYDPFTIQQQRGMATGFENDVVGWLPDGSHSQAPLFDASAPLNPLRDLSSTIYDPLLRGSGSTTNPNNAESFPDWPPPTHQTFTTSTSLFPQIQHGIVGPDLQDIMQSEQVEVPLTATHAQPNHQHTNYDPNKL
ncbi:agamous-like MADS-box protein AGL104, partial [Carica papaya]|uniref:agamous-like MADS-box protein AGL104 n=1 Tax=Carica papaya TaxID=3649 RepID=UPI000B8CAA8F